MTTKTNDDFQAFILKHNTQVQALISSLDKYDDIEDMDDFITNNGLDAGSYLLKAYTETIPTPSYFDDLKKISKRNLPKSYRKLLTEVGLLQYGADSTNSEIAYKMVFPHEMATLSLILQENWELDWSKEDPKLKKQTDEIILLSTGDWDLQKTHWVCLDYRHLNETTGEVPLFYFNQDDCDKT